MYVHVHVHAHVSVFPQQCSCTWCPEPTGCVLRRIDYALFIFPRHNRCDSDSLLKTSKLRSFKRNFVNLRVNVSLLYSLNRHSQQYLIHDFVTSCGVCYVPRLRQMCITLINKKWFDYTVLFFIALNCISLAVERPNIPDDSTVRDPTSLTTAR